MRRTLWNIYVWPISVLMLLGFFVDLSSLRPLSALDVALSIPALVALHLHVRDVKFLSPAFWKPFAFVYLAWDLFYNLAINPMQFPMPGPFLVLVFSLPLYVALFRYAFKSWSLQYA